MSFTALHLPASAKSVNQHKNFDVDEVDSKTSHSLSVEFVQPQLP